MRPFTSTFMLSGMRLSSSVSLNSDSISSSGSTVRERGSSTRRMSSADSSRTSASSGSFFSFSSSAIFSISRRLLHLPGNLGDDDRIGAAAGVLLRASARARGTSRGRSRRPRRSPPADRRRCRRSGSPAPARTSAACGCARSGVSIRCSAASHSSAALCGGIEVAMPTAMPCAPLASRLGKAAGSTTGSSSLAVVGRAEIDRVLVDAVEQQARDLGQPRLGVAHGRRRYRRRYCRNCPARRPADSAARNPARAAPARRRSPGRHAGGTCRSRRRRRARIS